MARSGNLSAADLMPEAETYQSDWAVHPGTYLRDVLEALDVPQSDLAARTGLTPKHINQVVNGAVGLSADVAVLLERALGIDSEIWTSLEVQYQHARSRQHAKLELASYEEWVAKFPVAELYSRHVIEHADNGIARVDKLLRFFGVASPDAFEMVWMAPVAAFRRSQKQPIDPYATALWLKLAERAADAVKAPPFRIGALRKAIKQITPLTVLPFRQAFASARDILAEAGVRLVFVEEVSGAKVCGATRWLSADRPFVVLTNRYKWEDVFWFTLLHELGHLVLHPRRATFVEMGNRADDDADSTETEADSFAADSLIPAEANPRILAATTRDELQEIALEYSVGENIVAGRHGKLTNEWGLFGKARPRVDAAEALAGLVG
jgi:HTH-type transcriptional regulator/antitoxin HigA